MKDSLVIILYDHPKEHTSDYVSQTCKYLCRHNFVAGILLKDAVSLNEIIRERRTFQWVKQIDLNYYLFQPLYILPFRRNTFIVNMNLFLNTFAVRMFICIKFFHRKFRNKYLWIFSPEHMLFMNIFPSFSSIYDCVDYHEPNVNTQIDNQFIRSVNFFFVNSRTQYTLYKSVRKAVLVPQGFRLDDYIKNRKNARVVDIPHDKPIIGYIGGMNYRLDYRLLFSLVKDHPQWLFVFIGPVQEYDTGFGKNYINNMMNKLISNNNCIYYPNQLKDIIPSLISQFTIGMIPYDIKYEFNKFCYPMKLYEYFYMGKPVIATPIEELKRFPKYVKIGSSVQEWEENIKLLLYKPWLKTLQDEQKRLAMKNSWKEKIKAIEQVIS